MPFRQSVGKRTLARTASGGIPDVEWSANLGQSSIQEHGGGLWRTISLRYFNIPLRHLPLLGWRWSSTGALPELTGA